MPPFKRIGPVGNVCVVFLTYMYIETLTETYHTAEYRVLVVESFVVYCRAKSFVIRVSGLS